MTNPNDNKERTEADKPEEKRKKEEKKRKNPKSETDKDEKNQSGQQADAKKQTSDTPVLQEEVIKSIIENGSLSQLKEYEKSEGNITTKYDWQNRTHKQVWNDVAKEHRDALILLQKKNKEMKAKAKKREAIMTGVGEGLKMVGDAISGGYNQGRAMMQHKK